MNYLKSGGFNPEKLDLLISGTKITSENVISALHDHLVRGANIDMASAMNSIQPSNLKRALNKVNSMAEIVEKIKEIDWAKFNSVK